MSTDDMDHADSDRGISRLWLVAGLAYFTAATSTIHLASNGRDIATIWPANAILVALLLADAKPRWGTVLSAGFLANVAANLITRGTLFGPVLFGLANLLEVGLAVVLLRKFGTPQSLLQSTGAVMRFILIAGFVAPVASGIAGSATAYVVFGEPIQKAFVTWVASDGLGLLVFSPFFSAVVRGDFVTCWTRKAWLERIEAVALLLIAGIMAYVAFYVTTRPMLFAIFPPLMLVTFRVGRFGLKAAVMVVAVIGGTATMQGYGPVLLMASDPAMQAHAFQAFLAVLLLTCLPVAAEVSARAHLTEMLAAHDREMTVSAMTDPLTGILNRAGFEEKAKRLLCDGSSMLSLIVIDFDHFKQINDRWGHQAGDHALLHLTSVLKSQVRAGDFIGRIGGDEFVIILANSDSASAAAVCDRIRVAVHAAPLSIDERSATFISLSMGGATAQPNEGYEHLVQRADKALYEAKEAGRNTIRWAA